MGFVLDGIHKEDDGHFMDRYVILLSVYYNISVFFKFKFTEFSFTGQLKSKHLQKYEMTHYCIFTLHIEVEEKTLAMDGFVQNGTYLLRRLGASSVISRVSGLDFLTRDMQS